MTAQMNGHIASTIGAGPASHGAMTPDVDGTYAWVLVEQLTHREQMVLDLLPSGLSYKELAHELGVSLNTVKSHLKSMYRKLAAGSRREAVERADRLGLLPGHGSSDAPSDGVPQAAA